MNRNLETRLTRLEVASAPPKKALPICFCIGQSEDEARKDYIERYGFKPNRVISFKIIKPTL